MLTTPHPLAVLKFGGSILAGDEHLRSVVHEIYRWIRDGYRVVAVVSALHGETNRLLARARRLADSPHPASVAKLAATGELASASLLGVALDRAGIPVEILDSAGVSLRTTPDFLDAEPLSVDTIAIHAALAQAPVLVLPGFIGRDDRNRTTLLGRGGSDMTALFLAHALRAARCRLVKDVDGLYDRDPADASATTPPRRFASISWTDAAALGSRVLQPKAVRFAHERQLAFEVAGPHRRFPTRVGPYPTTPEAGPLATPEVPPALRVVILGHGVVGAGVYQALAQLAPRFRVVKVAVRDVAKAHAAGLPLDLLTTDPCAAAATPCDLVIEALGGIDPALPALRSALSAGIPVVTANKAVIAAHGSELHELAAQHRTTLRYSAAVGGAVPVLETIARVAPRDAIVSLEALLNGTTNFVLGEVAAGKSFADAVRAAQDAGFAEADPSRDLDGRDALDKLILAARAAFGPRAESLTVSRTPLSAETLAAARAGAAPGSVVRHVVRLHAHDAALSATIAPEALPPSHPLAQVHREGNGVLITTAGGEIHAVFGKGAGRWPTTEAVIADVLDAADDALALARLTPRSESRV